MATGWGVHMQSACIILPLVCLWSFATIANRLATEEYSTEWQSPAAFITTKNDEKHAWGLMPDFLLDSYTSWSPLSVCIMWSRVVLRAKGSPLTTDDAITISAEYLNNVGSMKTWPPAVSTERLIIEPNPHGWSQLKTEWKYHAIATALNFVGRQNSSQMCDTSAVPWSLLPSAVTPLSFHARAECPTPNPEPSTVYVSPVSPAVIHAQSKAVTFRVSEELHISFDRELTLTAAGKLTQVLLQDEWPSAPRDQAHDPKPPALDWDNISMSASESSLEPAHNSENNTDYWDSY